MERLLPMKLEEKRHMQKTLLSIIYRKKTLFSPAIYYSYLIPE
jgi:hypothetical protein